MFKILIKKYYSNKVEDICVRILYFFNTIDTYYIIAGIFSFLLLKPHEPFNVKVLLVLTIIILLFRTTDFYPTFIIPSLPAVLFFSYYMPQGFLILVKIIALNAIFFVVIMTLFMSIPETIVARDFYMIVFRKLINSVFTIAPTTVSMSMSIYYSSFLSVSLFFNDEIITTQFPSIIFGIGVGGGVLLTYLTKPRSFISKPFFPQLKKAHFKRVIILNIDGCRMDVMREEKLPHIRKIIKRGASFPNGLETVFRALTNPAFASILTGTTPEVHGIKNNNLGQAIKVEALPDIVPTILYGSMHVKHFSKENWETKIVSLPKHSVYKADAIMQDWLKTDLKKRPEIKLFVVDYSEADFLAHAYGSRSSQYRKALRRIDDKIGDLIFFLKENKLDSDTAVIICSDHGIAAIDHSFLISTSEKYVPFIAIGKGICKGMKLFHRASIMDIACTVAYLLGVAYPSCAKGRVFTDILENVDGKKEEDQFVSLVNEAYYDSLASHYDMHHKEVVNGDQGWWFKKVSSLSKNSNSIKRVLDFGCGTGFIGEVFLKLDVRPDALICYDSSKKMLDCAKQKLPSKRFSFTNDWQEIKDGEKFNLICINSVLHHLKDVEAVCKELMEILENGGYIIGAHEPNRPFFEKNIVRKMASFYKLLGGGFNIDHGTVKFTNEMFKKNNYTIPFLNANQILQTVEYHSPVEQARIGIDQKKGFDEYLLKKKFFFKLHPIHIETYSTAFVRSRFEKLPYFESIGSLLFTKLFKTGNLIRYVFKKEFDRPFN